VHEDGTNVHQVKRAFWDAAFVRETAALSVRSPYRRRCNSGTARLYPDSALA
jgi:hypothetical protein